MIARPLRPFQREALTILRSHRSVHLICVAPTGAGKSRIFEEIARSSDAGRTLIIAPLQALVRQHQERLKSLGVEVVSRFSSSNTGLSQAMVTTPERMQQLLATGFSITPDTFFVVDECHCVDHWGKDFRPSLSKIPEIVSRFRIQKSLWLSATLPRDSRIALKDKLRGNVVELGHFSVRPQTQITKVRIGWAARPYFLKDFVLRNRSSGIVFSNTRRQCIHISRLLGAWSADPLASACYHAGLSREERLAVESGIRDRRISHVSATSAFGMGMDFEDLQWVILWQVPHSLLDLAQMIGRAGRKESAPSRSFLLWDEIDFSHLEHQTSGKELRALQEFFRQPESAQKSLQDFFNA